MPIRDNEPFKIAVYVADKVEEAKALEVLNQTRPNEVNVYSGTVTGWITRPLLKQILEAGLAVDETTMPMEQARSRRRTIQRVELPEQQQTPVLETQSAGRTYTADDLQFSTEVGLAPLAENNRQETRCLVHFRGPMRPDWLKQIKDNGLELGSKVSSNTYRMFLTQEQRETIRSLDFFVDAKKEEASQPRGVVRQSRLEELRSAGLVPETASLLGGGVPIPPKGTYDVSVHREKDLPGLQELLQKTPQLQVLESSADTVRFQADVDSPVLTKLSQMPEVKMLEEYKPPSLFCNMGTKVIGLTALAAAEGGLQWTGEGEVIGVLDSGADETHLDLQSAIIEKLSLPNAIPTDTIGHGTHVALIIAGRGAASGGAVRGAAPAAKLVMMSMIDAGGKLIVPVDYKTLFDPIVAKRARVLNMSWGWPIGGNYDQGSAQVDKYVYDNPEVLMVIAAGNSGIALDGEHKFKTVGAPATAKNAITVGACSSECDQAACPNKSLTWGQKARGRFPLPLAASEKVCGPPLLPAAISSRGPTDYESIKPDVLAPGVFVESTRSSTFSPGLFETGCVTYGPQYACCTGTSMAAPFVSAAAALLRHYMRQEHKVATPSAALVKALLIASARRLQAISPKREQMVGYPDYDQGFGIVDLSTILPHPGASAKRKLFWADVANDSVDALASRMPPESPRKSFRTYSFNVSADATERLRIVLCWTDISAVFLQNNLQLDVRMPNGSAIVGNHDNKRLENPLFDDLNVAGVAFDKRNNVEVIHVDKPPPGGYRVRVTAQNTPFPNQGYALVVSSESDSAELT